MPTNPEAARLNLEYYRKQAKALLKAAKSGDPAALQRVSTPKLHDAQLAIAHEQGFPSWPRFRAFIIQSGLDYQNLAAAFIDAAVSDLGRAEQMLAAHPNVAGAGFYAALVLGDSSQVEQALKRSPALATAKSGPQNCEPLLYVCFSRYANGKSRRAGGLVETARILLRCGADPNTAHDSLPCLYAATGLNNNPALAQVLLDAGADPNDPESLYHSTEHPDLECMKLLLRHGATANGHNALRHILDHEDLEGVRILLAAGADPNQANERGENSLHWAVWRGRSVSIIATLLDAGATPDAQRKDGRTAYALAVQSGQTEVAAFLTARGAKGDISPLDRFLGACATASPDELGGLVATYPDIAASPGAGRLLPDFTASHRTAAVRALLAAGLPVDGRGDWGGTALHWACWKGYADIVEILLANGASLTIEDEQFHGTPPRWFGHGVRNCHEPGGDYPK